MRWLHTVTNGAGPPAGVGGSLVLLRVPARAVPELAGALLAGLVCVELLVPPGIGRRLLELVIYGTGAAVVGYGMRLHRPLAARAWSLLTGALVLFAVSSLAEVLLLAGLPVPRLHDVESGLDIAGYLALFLAGIVVLLAGSPHRNVEVWIDAGTVLLAAVLLTGTWLDGAWVPGTPGGSGRDGVELELGVGLSLLTAVVLITGIHLTVSSKPAPSGLALLAAGVLAVTGYAIQIADPALPWVLDALPLWAVAAVAYAATHPSMADVGRPPPGSPVTSSRLLALGAGLLVNPALVLLWTVRHGGNGALFGTGIAALTVLSLWRIGRLTVEREHARVALQASESRLRALLQGSTDVIAVVGADGRISYLSPAAETLLQRRPDACVGRPFLHLVAAADRQRLAGALSRPDATGATSRLDVRVLRADGQARWVETRLRPGFREPGVDGWVVNLREITERKNLEDHLRLQASRDALTGVANRFRLLESVERSLAEGAEDERAGRSAVVYIDLDDFKSVNDRLGHHAGDELLVTVARRLESCVRPSDVVARLGGDEFAVLLDGAGPDHARAVAERIVATLHDPVCLAAEPPVPVRASVGVAVAGSGEDTRSLLDRADRAMYEAKRRGKDRLHMVDAAAVPAD